MIFYSMEERPLTHLEHPIKRLMIADSRPMSCTSEMYTPHSLVLKTSRDQRLLVVTLMIIMEESMAEMSFPESEATVWICMRFPSVIQRIRSSEDRDLWTLFQRFSLRLSIQALGSFNTTDKLSKRTIRSN